MGQKTLRGVGVDGFIGLPLVVGAAERPYAFVLQGLGQSRIWDAQIDAYLLTVRFYVIIFNFMPFAGESVDTSGRKSVVIE